MNANSHFTPLRRGAGGGNRGSALYLVLILGTVAAVVMATTFTYIRQSAKLEKRSDLRLESTYAAEYALEQAYQQLKSVIGRNGVNLPTISDTSAATNLSTAPTSVFSSQGYQWNAFLTVPIENGVPVAAHSNFNPDQGSYQYLSVVEITRPMPTGGKPVHEQFQRNWTYVIKPLFQYAIFCDANMELFPGANFAVTGRVHSNGKIYTGSGAGITFSDYVSDVGGFTNQYSPLDPRGPGSPGNNVTYNKGNPVTTTREEPPGALNSNTTDANVNNDGPRELIEIPNSYYSDTNSSERLYNKAGLKVLVNSIGSATTTASGVSVPANTRVFVTEDGTVIPASDPLATYLNTMFANGSMNDYREGVTLTTTDVDVSKVTAGYSAGGLPETIPNDTKWPNNGTVPSSLKGQSIPADLRGKDFWNGILYVADVTNESSHRTGVRLINGTSLPDGRNSSSPTSGLTVATENPAYIVGNYNTTSTRQPAAVLADAVTVVSSNWISGGYNSKSALDARTPVTTTINAAVIAGQVASDGSHYSGGMENFIRLLENWGGKTLNYTGSLINLFESKQATAPWRDTGGYYNAPARNWNFDTNFLDPNKLPPGSPVARSLKRGQWAQIY